jgi:hypothetical protein
MARPLLVTALVVLACTLANSGFLAVKAQESKDSLQQSWWMQFKQKESTQKATNPAGNNTSAAPFTSTSTTGGAGSSEVVAGAVQKGYFTVPAYFGSQPQPYERPVDVVRTPAARGWGSPLVGLTSMLPIPGLGFGNPFGWGMRSGWGGMGSGWGLGGIGLGWGGMGSSCGGWGWGGPATAAWQTAPSKPSGNYFAPSTIDTSASGSYYATTTPALTPTFSQPKPITNFWGSGSPFGRDASMPWNK